MRTDNPRLTETNSAASKSVERVDTPVLKISEKKLVDRLVDVVSAYFLRLNIARKLMLGYSSLLALLVIISVYALINLNRLNDINFSILKTDLPAIDISKKMIDVLLAQELHARRYLLLGTADVRMLFLDKTGEFDRLVEQVMSVPEHRKFPIEEIVRLHKTYTQLLFQGMQQNGAATPGFSMDFDRQIKQHQEKILPVIKQMAAVALADQNEKTETTATIGRVAFKAAAVLCGLGFIFSLTAAMLITRNISGAIKKLKYATGMISIGKFDHELNIRNRDELGDLAQAFVLMAKRLKQLEEMYLDTSPLTRLPGGVAIENVINKRIASAGPIAFCLMDIDNFKAYNDRYGYAKGNAIIQNTAALIVEAVAANGQEGDFVGHIGGDDFVVITTPASYRDICEAVIANFDSTIADFYDPADRKRGCIDGENRQGQKVSFPLASISIAVVTNEKRDFRNHIQFGEVAAEMKEHAKSVAGSVFMVDQRGDDTGKSKKDRKLIRLNPKKESL